MVYLFLLALFIGGCWAITVDPESSGEDFLYLIGLLFLAVIVINR